MFLSGTGYREVSHKLLVGVVSGKSEAQAIQIVCMEMPMATSWVGRKVVFIRFQGITKAG